MEFLIIFHKKLLINFKNSESILNNQYYYNMAYPEAETLDILLRQSSMIQNKNDELLANLKSQVDTLTLEIKNLLDKLDLHNARPKTSILIKVKKQVEKANSIKQTLVSIRKNLLNLYLGASHNLCQDDIIIKQIWIQLIQMDRKHHELYNNKIQKEYIQI
ncbi:hypothetical protein pb186bvf_010510 [Paramecium bursaria]